jgi:hypothetical protein
VIFLFFCLDFSLNIGFCIDTSKQRISIMPKMTQDELEEKKRIVPDQWMDPEPMSNDYLYMPIPNDDEIRSILKREIDSGNIVELAERFCVTKQSVRTWATEKKKNFTFTQWEIVGLVLNIHRALVINPGAQARLDEYATIKRDIAEKGLGWDSDKVGIEAYEALSHYLNRYYHRISIKKIAEQLGISESLIRWRDGTLSPYSVVGREVKARIRLVCNETWPDRYKMWDIYMGKDEFDSISFDPEDYGNKTVKSAKAVPVNVFSTSNVESLPKGTGKNLSPSGCSAVFLIILLIWGVMAFCL